MNNEARWELELIKNKLQECANKLEIGDLKAADISQIITRVADLQGSI